MPEYGERWKSDTELANEDVWLWQDLVGHSLQGATHENNRTQKVSVNRVVDRS